MSGDDFRALYALLISTNVLGNSLVILVILRSRSMKTPINYLLLNLAVADLMAGVSFVPPSILDGTFTHPQGLGGDILCKVITVGILAWISLYTSAFSLVLLAFDRYYAIMKPLSIRHRITTRKLKKLIPICWTTAAILCVPYFYFGKINEKEQTCRVEWPNWLRNFILLLNFLLTGILPAGIMAVLYSRVIHRLWFKQNGEDNIMLQAVKRSRKKITKTMLTLSAIYVLCWFPDLVRHNLEVFFPSHFSFTATVSDVFHSVVVLNSTVNPIVYAFQFQEFRKGLRKIFCCERRSNRIHVTP